MGLEDYKKQRGKGFAPGTLKEDVTPEQRRNLEKMAQDMFDED